MDIGNVVIFLRCREYLGICGTVRAIYEYAIIRLMVFYDIIGKILGVRAIIWATYENVPIKETFHFLSLLGVFRKYMTLSSRVFPL